jgi:aldose 1-epimerase
VSAAEQILTLGCDDVTLTVHPAAGARIGQIHVSGQPLLIDVPSPHDREPTAWGSFAMVPWVGRIRNGRFTFDDVGYQLPINHHDGPDPGQAHAIHGLGVDRMWDVHDVPGTTCTCSLRLDWEFGGIATQTIAVFGDRVVVTSTVESTGASFPAEVGWHPWFRKPDRLEFSPTAMYERDEFGVPTGQLVEPSDPPWDDCFVTTEPILLHYDRPIAPIFSVTSVGDHVVIYDHPDDATCVEPQTGPPDSFNLSPHVVAPGSPLTHTMTISW